MELGVSHPIKNRGFDERKVLFPRLADLKLNPKRCLETAQTAHAA
jgi:hypothetical protein